MSAKRSEKPNRLLYDVRLSSAGAMEHSVRCVEGRLSLPEDGLQSACMCQRRSSRDLVSAGRVGRNGWPWLQRMVCIRLQFQVRAAAEPGIS